MYINCKSYYNVSLWSRLRILIWRQQNDSERALKINMCEHINVNSFCFLFKSQWKYIFVRLPSEVHYRYVSQPNYKLINLSLAMVVLGRSSGVTLHNHFRTPTNIRPDIKIDVRSGFMKWFLLCTFLCRLLFFNLLWENAQKKGKFFFSGPSTKGGVGGGGGESNPLIHKEIKKNYHRKKMLVKKTRRT